MRRRVSRTLPWLAFALLLAATAGAEPPLFPPLRLLQGGTLDSADLAGHVVVVRFLASW